MQEFPEVMNRGLHFAVMPQWLNHILKIQTSFLYIPTETWQWGGAAKKCLSLIALGHLGWDSSLPTLAIEVLCIFFKFIGTGESLGKADTKKKKKNRKLSLCEGILSLKTGWYTYLLIWKHLNYLHADASMKHTTKWEIIEAEWLSTLRSRKSLYKHNALLLLNIILIHN